MQPFLLPRDANFSELRIKGKAHPQKLGGTGTPVSQDRDDDPNIMFDETSQPSAHLHTKQLTWVDLPNNSEMSDSGESI